DVAQYVVGVAAQGGRRQVVFDGGAAQAQRAGDGADRAAAGPGDVDAQAAVPHLRVLEDLLVVVDAAAGHVGGCQARDPVRRAARQNGAGQFGHQGVAADDAALDLGPARVGGQVGALDGGAVALPLHVVADRDDDLAVGHREDLVGHQAGVGVAVAVRDLAVGEVAGDLVAAQGDDAVQQGHVDVLPLAGYRAMVQRGQDGDGGVHAGDDVGDGDAGFLRAAAGQVVAFAGDAHQPADGLEHEVVAGLAGAGAVLAVAGDGAVHQARVDGAQAVVVQAVAPQVADFVVLYQDVAARGQFAHQLLPGRAGDVDGDGLLAAVGGGVVGRVGGVVAMRVAGPGRAPGARVVAAAGALDLDDFGAQVGQVLGAPGPGQDAAQVEHAQVRQGAWRGGGDGGVGHGEASLLAYWMLMWASAMTLPHLSISAST